MCGRTGSTVCVHCGMNAGSLWPCPHLSELSIDCYNATSAIHAASSQLRRRTHLTSLVLNGLYTELDPHAWASFFGGLAPLHRLRRLHLRPYHAASQGLTTRLTEALRSFRKLTELSLHGGGPQDAGEVPVLRCDIFAKGLRAVTALRVLGLHDVGLVVPGELWGALRGLTLLEELRVSFCQVRPCLHSTSTDTLSAVAGGLPAHLSTTPDPVPSPHRYRCGSADRGTSCPCVLQPHCHGLMHAAAHRHA